MNRSDKTKITIPSHVVYDDKIDDIASNDTKISNANHKNNKLVNIVTKMKYN